MFRLLRSRALLVLVLAIGMTGTTLCQPGTTASPLMFPDSLNRNRLTGVLIGQGTIYAGAITGISLLYYQGEEPGTFHFYNDNGSWLQMDKMGHTFAAYYLSRVVHLSYRWAGLDRKKAILYGTLLPFAFQLNMEVFDGLYSKWGFSWGDVAANTFGCVLFASQQLAWDEQRMCIKYSYHPSGYTTENPAILGSTFVENLWEDYNGMTFWVSGNVAAFLPKATKFPKWLNVAVGYGVEGQAVNAAAHPPCRQFFLSPDIDLSRIPVRSRSLRVLLNLLNLVKVPMPGLEFNTVAPSGSVKFHLFCF